MSSLSVFRSHKISENMYPLPEGCPVEFVAEEPSDITADSAFFKSVF
jgi:hypothetical protein